KVPPPPCHPPTFFMRRCQGVAGGKRGGAFRRSLLVSLLEQSEGTPGSVASRSQCSDNYPMRSNLPLPVAALISICSALIAFGAPSAPQPVRLFTQSGTPKGWLVRDW